MKTKTQTFKYVTKDEFGNEIFFESFQGFFKWLKMEYPQTEENLTKRIKLMLNLKKVE